MIGSPFRAGVSMFGFQIVEQRGTGDDIRHRPGTIAIIPDVSERNGYPTRHCFESVRFAGVSFMGLFDAINNQPRHVHQRIAAADNDHERSHCRLVRVIHYRDCIGIGPGGGIVMKHCRAKHRRTAISEIPRVAGNCIVVGRSVRIEGQFDSSLAISRAADDGGRWCADYRADDHTGRVR